MASTTLNQPSYTQLKVLIDYYNPEKWDHHDPTHPECYRPAFELLLSDLDACFKFKQTLADVLTQIKNFPDMPIAILQSPKVNSPHFLEEVIYDELIALIDYVEDTLKKSVRFWFQTEKGCLKDYSFVNYRTHGAGRINIDVAL